MASLGQQMLVVAIDWELYQRTHSALALAMVGLSLMVPMILFTVPAGHFADTFNRKKIILAPRWCSPWPAWGWRWPRPGHFRWAGFISSCSSSARRGPFSGRPARRLSPAWCRSRNWPAPSPSTAARSKLSSVVGPAAFGAVLALTPGAVAHHSAWPVYALNALASLACFALVVPIQHVHKVKPRRTRFAPQPGRGIPLCVPEQIILGTITLDLFAVLLGGAVTILPMFANDIFHTGPGGLGWLRNAMAVGAVVCAFVIAHRPPLQKAGRAMLWAVAIFGAGHDSVRPGQPQLFRPLAEPAQCRLVLAGLRAAGAGGRGGQHQRRRAAHAGANPDAGRKARARLGGQQPVHRHLERTGRLSLRHGGVSVHQPTLLGNAPATGAIISTVSGGIGTILVVLAVAWIWPEIRRYGKLG